MSLETYPEIGYQDAETNVDLRQFWSILRKRRATFIQIFVLVLVVGAAATVLSKPVFQTKTKIVVPVGSSTVSVLNSNDPLALVMAGIAPEPVTTQIQMIQTRPFIAKAMEDAHINTPPGVVKPSVKVEVVRDTPNVIQVTVEGGDPNQIAALANQIVENHLKATDSKRVSGFDKALEYMEKETRDANRELQAANRALALFRDTHPVSELEAVQDALQKSLMEAQSSAVEAQSNLASTTGQIARIKARLSGMPDQIVKNRQIPNPERALVQEKLSAARVQRKELSVTHLPESDEIKDIDEKIAIYTASLEATPPFINDPLYILNPTRDALEKQLTALEGNLISHQESLNGANAQVGVLRGQLKATSPWKPKYDDLTQTQERARARYNMLSDKLQDLRIKNETPAKNASVLEAAGVPSTPVQPKPAMNIALAVMLGLALAVGVVFLQEYLDDRIHEPDDLQRLARLPSLGHIPAIGTSDTHLVAQLASDSHVAEAYRSVRSAIGFAGLDGPLRLLQITSASKGEGKSLTSVNTATAMAMDGKKIILVDADMRRPSLHRVLTLPLSPGLSEVLVGQKTWQEVLHEGPVPNLRIMCAGTMPPNPAELLGARSFVQLTNDLMEQADVVIFDTPPCLPVTDPLIVASRMDAVILVISAGSTRRGAIKHVMGLLTRARARVVGAVFNRVDAKQGGYYYQYYKHYYGDGYYSDTDSSDRRRNGKLPETAGSEAGIPVTSSKD